MKLVFSTVVYTVKTYRTPRHSEQCSARLEFCSEKVCPFAWNFCPLVEVFLFYVCIIPQKSRYISPSLVDHARFKLTTLWTKYQLGQNDVQIKIHINEIIQLNHLCNNYMQNYEKFISLFLN